MSNPSILDLAMDAINKLKIMAAIAVISGTRDGDHYRIHTNLVDNVANALQTLGFDFGAHKVLKKMGDSYVAQPPQPGSVSQLAQRVAELQAILDRQKAGYDWSPVEELFHPDMNITDIKVAVEALLKVMAAARDHMRRTGHVSGDDELRHAIGVAYTALWEGLKTHLEKDQSGDQSPEQEDPLEQLRNALGFVGELPELIAEVKRLVRIERERVRIATHLEFTNAHIIADALRLPKLVDALSHVATFENERAVRQALRNLDPEKRGAQHNDRALWDTMFTHSFEQVLEKWNQKDALGAIARCKATGESLWQCLDDIDSLSDKIKPDSLRLYSQFYTEALAIAKKRHWHLRSDGYVLTWPDGGVVTGATTQKYSDLVNTIEHLAQGYSFEPKFQEHQNHAKLLHDLFDRAHVALHAPVPMLLHCPMCHTRHIDEGEFATKKHHTHACQGYIADEGKRRRCGHVWRPAIVATVGVEALPGFVNDAVEGEKLVGKRARVIANGLEFTIERYEPDECKYTLVNAYPARLKLMRHEFSVLDP